ncbi:MAG TPA: hypothetical protein VNR87_12570 [Flavisolibacter sp.]|nr:hypothetical protein [Flavisolibacter sp.]
MKNILLIVIFCSLSKLSDATDVPQLAFNADSLPRPVAISLEKGEKIYCSNYRKARYKILITATKIRITYLYKDYVQVIHGVIRKGKIYTDDPDEKRFKEYAGRIYVLEKSIFSVKNLENGEYDYFKPCN